MLRLNSWLLDWSITGMTVTGVMERDDRVGYPRFIGPIFAKFRKKHITYLPFSK